MYCMNPSVERGNLRAASPKHNKGIAVTTPPDKSATSTVWLS